jgi:hypothetical protein
MSKYDMNIHRDPDAMAWTNFFLETTKDMDPSALRDPGYMVGWFANAMMAMHDHLIYGKAPLNGDHAQAMIDAALGDAK